MKTFKLEENIKIDSGFKVPDNYFDDFDAKILNRLPKNNPPVISIFRRSYFWVSGAAAVLVVALSISILYKNSANDTFTNEEILSIHENLTTEDLANLLTENDIQSLEKTLIDYDLNNKNLVIENL